MGCNYLCDSVALFIKLSVVMEIGFYPENLWIAIPLFIISVGLLILSRKIKKM